MPQIYFFLPTSGCRRPKKTYLCRRDERRLSRVGKAGARKVGTAQSTILPNGKGSARITASATEKYRLERGKGENVRQELTRRVATCRRGKPYGLQNQVRRCWSARTERAARPSLLGRSLEPVGDCRPREMTVAPQGEQNPAYHSHRFFYNIFLPDSFSSKHCVSSYQNSTI